MPNLLKTQCQCIENEETVAGKLCLGIVHSVFATILLHLLLTHINTTHNDENDFFVYCGIDGCDRRFEKANTFARHVREKHRFNPHPELSALCDRMWQEDKNRLTPGVDYVIDPQGRTRYHSRSDHARDPLFSYVSEEVLQRETYRKFIALLDNYNSETGYGEVVTQQEVRENQDFIDAIMKTEPIKIAHQFLAGKGLAPSDPGLFKRELYYLWFKLYRRSKGVREMDSSGFEHVFVGETRNRAEVIGFHNWIQFYLQEKNGAVDYKGFFSSRRRRNDMSESQLVTIQFSWKGDVKPIGSSFIGTSPEFEVAVYTVCFLAGDSEEVHLEIDDYEVIIKTHRIGKYLGCCYPVGR